MSSPALSLYSEPYGSTGNIGENFRRLLGAPALNPLQTVIREAVQNVADAAKLGRGPEILIRLRTLTSEQREVLRSVVFETRPKERSSQEMLSTSLARPSMVVLEICDFRTTGLGGPTRSDRIPIGTERTDFIDFLRDIGTPRETKLGGGTYGFGKVALYRASRCSTIIVDTLPYPISTDGRRMIGCHVGRSFHLPDDGLLRRFTGRHWWGAADPKDGVVDPIMGDRASNLAHALGFPEREYGRTGTSIMILDLDRDDMDLHVTGHRIVESVLWNFWPRLMNDVPESRRFSCQVEVDGIEIEVPAPEEHAPFHLFCKAMRASRNRSGHDVKPIRSMRPARFLGTLAVEKGLRSERRPLVSDGSLIPPVVHHIALMRPVELIVKYLEGTPLPDEQLEWAGTFLASSQEEVERAFADSEPPTHDDWIPDNLPKGRAKSYVNIALTRLRHHAAEIGETTAGAVTGRGAGPPLARVASRLGAILEGVERDGASRRRTTTTGGRPKRPRRCRATRPIFDRLELSDIGRVAVFTTDVIQDPSRSGATLSASASIAIEGTGTGRIDDEEMIQPTVLSIRASSSSSASDGARLALNGEEGRFELRVLVPEDCAVIVNAEVLSEHA